jgi:hypothetical protein
MFVKPLSAGRCNMEVPEISCSATSSRRGRRNPPRESSERSCNNGIGRRPQAGRPPRPPVPGSAEGSTASGAKDKGGLGWFSPGKGRWNSALSPGHSPGHRLEAYARASRDRLERLIHEGVTSSAMRDVGSPDSGGASPYQRSFALPAPVSDLSKCF